MPFYSSFSYKFDALFEVAICLLHCPVQLADGCGGVGDNRFGGSEHNAALSGACVNAAGSPDTATRTEVYREGNKGKRCRTFRCILMLIRCLEAQHVARLCLFDRYTTGLDHAKIRAYIYSVRHSATLHVKRVCGVYASKRT
jgi:hypothetical protein